MMKTPLSDFLREYSEKNALRLHMPGHKGVGGFEEKYDITEIDGADSLFEADGVIKDSENIAGEIFGADSFYSTEGSSLSIRAMLYLATLYAKRMNRRPIIAAGRNAHKAFTSAAALVDFEVDWILSESASYLSSRFSGRDIETYLNSARELPVAVYITSPDYLGFTSEIAEIAKICHEKDVLLLVDNAHGAYLKFLENSQHPITLGADMCCDSAHKTLSALTGCAYLHVSKSAPAFFKERAKNAMMTFASTSPSYLMLASLDRLNSSLGTNYREKLGEFIKKISRLKDALTKGGYAFTGDEPMKLTVCAKEYGYLGSEIAKILAEQNIYVEFSDSDYLVLMPTPENTDEDLKRLFDALTAIPKKARITTLPPPSHIPNKKLSIREAVMTDTEIIPINECLGRIASAVTLGCPPAIPLAMPGEIIDEQIIESFNYYGIDKCLVVK